MVRKVVILLLVVIGAYLGYDVVITPKKGTEQPVALPIVNDTLTLDTIAIDTSVE